MKIFVKAKPNAREEKVEELDVAHFVVSVKEPPREGKANAAIVRALARYFNVSQTQVSILSGHGARMKIVEIAGGEVLK